MKHKFITALMVELIAVAAIATEFNTQPIYHCTFDSTNAVTQPAAGSAGTLLAGSFVDGKFGKALLVPAYTQTVVVPFQDGLPANEGTIEFWAKLESDKETYSDAGDPGFLFFTKDINTYPHSAVEFNANDGSGRGGLIGRIGGISIAPEGYSGYKPYSTYIPEGQLNSWHHYVLTWNINGIDAIEGKPTTALILDGKLIGTVSLPTGWNTTNYLATMADDTFLRIGGTQATQSKTPFLIDELKIWNVAIPAFSPTNPQLIFHCTFDSSAAVETPAVGPKGTLSAGSFTNGKVGKSLSVPALTATADFEFPNGLPPDKGTIEFWARLDGNKTSFFDAGDPCLMFISKDRNTYPHITAEYNANDGCGKGGLIARIGLIPLSHESYSWSKPYSSYIPTDQLNSWHHYAIVWNTNGISSIQGNPDAAFLLDGVAIETVNLGNGWDQANYIATMAQAAMLGIGGSGFINSKSPYSIDELKIWDADITDFTISHEPDIQEENGFSYKTTKSSDGNDCAIVTTAPVAEDGSLAIPDTLAGLPVAGVLSGAFDSAKVKSASVPASLARDPSIWDPNTLVNIALIGDAPATGVNFSGLSSLEEIVLPKKATLCADSFAGCWALKRVVFQDDWTISNDPSIFFCNLWSASLYQMADMICYPAEYSERWEKILGNAGFGGLYGAYEGEWDGVDSLVADSGNLASKNAVPTVVTNMVFVYTTVTNEIHYIPDAPPPSGPSAQYVLKAGVDEGTALPDAAGWDALGLPDGMTWDSKTGTLSGVPKKAGTYSYTTKAGEPVRIEILPTPATAVGTFNGTVKDETGAEHPVKVTTTAAGKVSASVIIGTKTYSLNATAWGSFETTEIDGKSHFVLSATLKAKDLEMSATLDTDATWNSDALKLSGTHGAVDGMTGSAQRNSFADNTDATAAAAALAGTYSLDATPDEAGGWSLATAEEGKTGAVTIKLKVNGSATISGKYPDKTSASGSTTLHIGLDGSATLRFYTKGKWTGFTL